MESTGFNIVLGGGQKLSGDMENSKYNIVLYDDQEYSGDSDFTAHEPPAYRSVYVADVQIDEATGHLIVTLSDGTTIDSGYVRGSQGVPGTPGTNGTNGKDGKDGHSPVVTAEKSGKITIIAYVSYCAKAKKENTRGGITYEMAMREPQEDAVG